MLSASFKIFENMQSLFLLPLPTMHQLAAESSDPTPSLNVFMTGPLARVTGCLLKSKLGLVLELENDPLAGASFRGWRSMQHLSSGKTSQSLMLIKRN